MKFVVNIDDDENVSSIEYMVAEEIARQVISGFNIEQLKKQTNDEIQKQKEVLIKGFKAELNDWNKSDILFELNRLLGTGWVKTAAKEVVEMIKKDSQFVNSLAREILKLQFNGKE